MLANGAPEQTEDTLNTMINLVKLLAVPVSYYHNDWVKEFGPVVIEAVKTRLLSTTDIAMNEVKTEKLVELFDSIELISKRFMVN